MDYKYDILFCANWQKWTKRYKLDSTLNFFPGAVFSVEDEKLNS